MNTANPHPTFTNPTIQEALCEIHFRLPENVEWKPTLFGEVFKQIQQDFPELEPLMQVGFRFQVGAKGVGQEVSQPQPRMRYRHANRNLLLQLSATILTVNVLPRYDGWDQMSRDVLDGWERVSRIVSPAMITRVGLRYINRIERSGPGQTLGDWLKANDYVPGAILSSMSGFFARVEASPETNRRLVVTVGEIARSDQSGADIILDLDSIIEKEMSPTVDTIAPIINVLHDAIWQVFATSMTPKLEQLLTGDK
ncbi:MAG: TIGR04255 family protein [Chloroflexi bacterium]|nr:TIGR04255 family protein [Chloroflexota bacterium]